MITRLLRNKYLYLDVGVWMMPPQSALDRLPRILPSSSAFVRPPTIASANHTLTPRNAVSWVGQHYWNGARAPNPVSTSRALCRSHHRPQWKVCATVGDAPKPGMLGNPGNNITECTYADVGSECCILCM